MSPLHPCSSLLTGLSASRPVLLKLVKKQFLKFQCVADQYCSRLCRWLQKHLPSLCSSVTWPCHSLSQEALVSSTWVWADLNDRLITSYHFQVMPCVARPLEKAMQLLPGSLGRLLLGAQLPCFARPCHVERAVLGDPVNGINSLPWVIAAQMPDMWMRSLEIITAPKLV